MKKTLFFLLAVTLAAAFSSCKKDCTSAPTPAVVGTWDVQVRLIDAATGAPGPDGFDAPFELELNEGETGNKRIASVIDIPLEWDLINGDQTIVLTTGQNIFNPDQHFFSSEILNILHQSEQSAEWESNFTYSFTDSLTGTTTYFARHWYLQRR